MMFPEQYDAWYETPFGNYAYWLEKEGIESFCGESKGRKVLDIGCGTGRYSFLLAEKGAQLTALDPSEEMLSYAKNKAEKKGLKIKFVKGKAERLPFQDHSFDIILSVTSFEFMKKHKLAVEEMMRVCRKGGAIVLATINKLSSYSLLKRKSRSYSNTRFFSIFELKSMFGTVQWKTTLFALPFFPESLLKLFSHFEHFFSFFLKPFGAVILLKKEIA